MTFRTLLDHGNREERSLAHILTAMMLAARNALPRGANGKAPHPSNLLAASKRTSVVSKKADPFGMLLTIAECDLKDGCTVDDVTLPFRQMIAHLECVGRNVRPSRPLATLMRIETRTQASLDLAELAIASNPTDDALLIGAKAAGMQVTVSQVLRDELLHEYAQRRTQHHAGVCA